MIDAYEVGIQLLLQEDVSAGLEIIGRGLAHVDQAIAATTANLTALANQAGATTKAVAVAVSDRKVLTPAKGQSAEGAPEPTIRQAGEANRTVTPTSTKDGATETPTVSSSEKAAAPELKAAEPSSPTKPAAEPPNEVGPKLLVAAPDPTLPSSAPINTDLAEITRKSETSTKTPVAPEPSASAVSAKIDSAARLPNTVGSSPSRRLRPLELEPQRNGRSPGRPVALTASVSHAQQSSTSAPGPERGRYPHPPGIAAQRERPAAPWSGVDHSGKPTETSRLPDKAAAPQAAGRNDNEFGGGTVVLDGRLVGQWLSEHMGREASRPPSGTSFFDARQTPAWTVSGAL